MGQQTTAEKVTIEKVTYGGVTLRKPTYGKDAEKKPQPTNVVSLAEWRKKVTA